MKKTPRHPTAPTVRAAAAVAFMLGAAALTAAPLSALAADLNAVNNAARIASSVGVGTAAPAIGFGAVLQTIVALGVVVGLVFACAWIARRLGLQPSGRGNVLKTVGGLSLGGKERVAVVEIGDTWLVLGAAPGNVRLLHTLPAGSGNVSPAAPPSAGGLGGLGGPGASDAQSAAYATLPGTFGARFRAALAAETKKRLFRPSGGDK
ncbi:MAG: flagellar protein FliO/FliZ [Paraburkholderia sp.]|nr:flagellar protein FliO/FliZ [Paraburkholderia sp.]MEA3122573.1 flagellar protein FliO/FliZ [Paraburkholderia sp.]